MLIHLFLIAWLSYQAPHAYASGFVQKSIQKGDNVISILQKNGFNESERAQLLQNNKKLQELFLTLDTHYLLKNEGAQLELRLYDAQKNVQFQITKEKNKVSAHEFEPQFKTSLLRVSGRLYSSLFESIYNQTQSNWVASRFLDAYIFDLQKNSLKKGSPFWLSVEKKYDQGFFIKYGEVTQTSLQVGTKNFVKKLVRNRDASLFVSDQDNLNHKPLFAPANYLRVASLFQPHRLHPITHKRQPHLGIDLELPEGAPVLAPNKAVVLRFGMSPAAGHFIVLRHPGGLETSYNHLSRFEKSIKIGKAIASGEKIAEVGCTGYCTRPHLHFAVKYKGQMQDPIRFMRPYPARYERIVQSYLAKN